MCPNINKKSVWGTIFGNGFWLVAAHYNTIYKNRYNSYVWTIKIILLLQKISVLAPCSNFCMTSGLKKLLLTPGMKVCIAHPTFSRILLSKTSSYMRLPLRQ